MLGILLIAFSILFFLGFFESSKAGLLIDADPVSTVFINDKEVGKTPYETETVPSDVYIKIKPENINGYTFDDYETKVNLVSGIKTIIKRTFNMNEEYSSGVIVSFEKVASRNSFVTVVSIPDNVQVLIDGKIYGYTPLRVSVSAGDHDMSIVADKYLEKKLPIRVYKGYKLTAFVKLAKSNEPDPLPIVTDREEIKFRIRINKTDVGFLRVRSGSSIGFPEVGQVKQDEVYDVLEEGENGKWYKIQMVGEDGVPTETGWVSAEFVTKI